MRLRFATVHSVRALLLLLVVALATVVATTAQGLAEPPQLRRE